MGENLWSRDGRRPLPRDPLRQKLEVAAVDPVAPHDQADQGICHQLGGAAAQRAQGGSSGPTVQLWHQASAVVRRTGLPACR